MNNFESHKKNESLESQARKTELKAEVLLEASRCFGEEAFSSDNSVPNRKFIGCLLDTNENILYVSK